MFRRLAHSSLSLVTRGVAADVLQGTRVAACGCSNSLVDTVSLRHRGQRSFADLADEPEEVRTAASDNQRLNRLVNEIVSLNLVEVADLTELLRVRLKIDAIPGMMPMMGGGGAQQAAAPAQEAAPAKEEQTEFDVTLESFGASDKIKVIKEVRAVLPELGLKDAKVLVGVLCFCNDVCLHFCSI